MWIIVILYDNVWNLFKKDLANVVVKKVIRIKYRWMEFGGISVFIVVKSLRNLVISCDIFVFIFTRSFISVFSVFEFS